MKALNAVENRRSRAAERPHLLLPWLSWKFSLVLPVALIAIAATLLFHLLLAEPDTIAFRVVDATTGEPVTGAAVTFGSRSFMTNDDGVALLPDNMQTGQFSVAGNGFSPVTGSIDANSSYKQQVRLPRATTSESLEAGKETQSQANSVLPTEVPQASVLQGNGTADSARNTVPTMTPVPTPTEPVRNVIEGTVTAPDGKPIQGARITDGLQLQVTGKDGMFSLEGTALAPDATIRVSASGYADQSVPVTDVTEPFDVVLDLHPIKAIYMNPNISTSDDDVNRLIRIIDTTDANAIVIDIKEEAVFYDTQVTFFRDSGTVAPILDLPALLKKLHDHHIYVIARLVVFKDSMVAEAHPDMAVLNNQTGDLWRDMNGVAWVNPMIHDLWEANTDLAVEAATLGFDEIQYDYIRFPTDGDLSTMDFGLPNNQENREAAISKFLDMSRKKLMPTGAKMSADVFGYTLLVDDDLGIGQNFIELADYVDYLSPMVYPSHFPDGSIAVDGQPNDFPYETIDISMRAGKRKLDGSALQIRPWLQDFSFFDMTPYGDDEVRAQIKAANDVGTSGWMLWDPNNEFHPGAFPLEDGGTPVPPVSTPIGTPLAWSPVGSITVTRGRIRGTHR